MITVFLSKLNHRQLYYVEKNTETIFWLLPMNCLSAFDYFLRLALKGLNFNKFQPIYACTHSPYKKEYMSLDFSF